MKEKQAVTREYKTRYQKAGKKAKSTLLDEFTRLTGYHRKSAVRLLRGKPVREILVSQDGKAVKLKPEKKRPANRTGKRVYSDEVIAAPLVGDGRTPLPGMWRQFPCEEHTASVDKGQAEACVGNSADPPNNSMRQSDNGPGNAKDAWHQIYIALLSRASSV